VHVSHDLYLRKLERGDRILTMQITRALALVRHPLAYTSVERVNEVLKLSYYDPIIVGEVARGLGVIAKGKGEDKASHLTAKVSAQDRDALGRGTWADEIQLLWAQKMWNFALPKLMEGDANAKGKITHPRE
jgi:DNA repair/transcription protein MET18/MMS19